MSRKKTCPTKNEKWGRNFKNHEKEEGSHIFRCMPQQYFEQHFLYYDLESKSIPLLSILYETTRPIHFYIFLE